LAKLQRRATQHSFRGGQHNTASEEGNTTQLQRRPTQHRLCTAGRSLGHLVTWSELSSALGHRVKFVFPRGRLERVSVRSLQSCRFVFLSGLRRRELDRSLGPTALSSRAEGRGSPAAGESSTPASCPHLPDQEAPQSTVPFQQKLLVIPPPPLFEVFGLTQTSSVTFCSAG